MTTLIAAVFVASLLGSLHCAGMCGGVLALCFGPDDGRGNRGVAVHVAYHGGRLVTYSALGALSGAVGAAFDLGGRGLGLTRGAAVVAGVLMIGYGVVALLRTQGIRFGCAGAGPAGALFARGLRRVIARPPVERALAIGLLTGLLPCGWLYAFVIAAGGTGDPLVGAVAMAVFWAGTLPVMVTLGLGVQRLLGPLRRHVPALTACLLVAVGLFTVLGRLNAPALAAVETTAAACEDGDVVARVEAIDQSELACCHDGD